MKTVVNTTTWEIRLRSVQKCVGFKAKGEKAIENLHISSFSTKPHWTVGGDIAQALLSNRADVQDRFPKPRLDPHYLIPSCTKEKISLSFQHHASAYFRPPSFRNT